MSSKNLILVGDIQAGRHGYPLPKRTKKSCFYTIFLWGAFECLACIPQSVQTAFLPELPSFNLIRSTEMPLPSDVVPTRSHLEIIQHLQIKLSIIRPSLCPNPPPCVLRPLRRSGEAVLDGSPRVVVVQVQTVKVLGKYIMANMRKLQLFARRNILAIIRKLYDFSLFFL